MNRVREVYLSSIEQQLRRIQTRLRRMVRNPIFRDAAEDFKLQWPQDRHTAPHRGGVLSSVCLRDIPDRNLDAIRMRGKRGQESSTISEGHGTRRTVWHEGEVD